VDAALERSGEPAQPGVQPEHARMVDDTVGGEGVDGGLEGSARGDGHGYPWTIGRPARRGCADEQDAECGMRNTESMHEARVAIPHSAFPIPHSHSADPRLASR